MGKSVFVGAASGLILAACASGGPNISPEQCVAADWYAVGVGHGKQGANITEINPVMAACETTSNPVDIARYKEGRTEGLKSYCTPLTLLDAAAQGTGDPYACDPVTPAMKASIDKGVETRQAAARYQQIQAQYKQLTDQKTQIQQQLQQVQQEGQQLNQTLPRANETTNPTRAQIQQRLNYLQQQYNAGTQQLAQLDQQIEQANPVMQKEKQTYDAAVQSYNTYKSSLGGGS